MSAEALLTGVRDFLRAQLNLSDKFLDIQPFGRPPYMMGKFYIAIDQGDTICDAEEFMREKLAIDITVTIKAGEFPPNQSSSYYLSYLGQLEAQCRPIVLALHGNYASLTNFNATIGYNPTLDDDSRNVFIRPLFFRSASKPRFEDGSWSIGGLAGDGRYAYIVRSLRFAGALRNQYLNNLS